MTKIFIFILFFFLTLLSTIGYGLFFQRVCFYKNKSNFKNNTLYLGFYGLFLITFISLITSLFISHSYTHNIILHTIGLLFLFSFKIENKKKYLKDIFIISTLAFSALLISKGHDDLSYYHLSFTKYLTEQKIIFGMGHLNHGYNLLSSLFFLNSTFYLPFIDYYSFHYAVLFFLIFFNYFLIKEIYSVKNHEIIRYLYIFAFAYFNLSFNRIAEYGTDKTGQLLIVILIIKLFQIIFFDNKKKKINEILYLIPLLAYCISLKTYFLPYVLLSLAIFFINRNYTSNLKMIFFSNSVFAFFLCLIFYFFHHFVSTGCFISPLSFTCFGENVSWGRKVLHIEGLSLWLEQWAKAAAGPNFRVENMMEYIKGFNWISNWIEKYFLEKFLDQLAILFVSFIFIFIFFKKFKLNKIKINVKIEVLFYYLILLIIFFIWLLNHPTLRYGGYSVVFLIISFPVTLLFYYFSNKKIYEKNIKYFILLIIILFNTKNFVRINNELNREDIYKYINFPFFTIIEKNYKENKFDAGLSIYSAHHCWATPTPCGQVDNTINVQKKYGYFFITKLKN